MSRGVDHPGARRHPRGDADGPDAADGPRAAIGRRHDRSPTGTVDRLVDGVHPVAGAIVMGTGIVSTALLSTGHHGLADVLLWIAVALWAGLAAVVALRVARAPAAVLRGSRTAESLTAVAATCVLGTRLVLDGRDVPALVLLVLGAVLWAVLIGPDLRALPERAHGGTLLLCVATEAVAGLAAGLAAARDASWLLVPAVPLAVFGLVLYLDVLRRIDPREPLTGRGDHWVLGGALAIATLAWATIQDSATTLGAVPDVYGALRVVTLVVGVAAALWLPVLIASEVARPRLRYDARRWATVFPAGMYVAAAARVGTVEDATWPVDVARISVWAALALWVVVAAGLVRHVAGRLRGADAAA